MSLTISKHRPELLSSNFDLEYDNILLPILNNTIDWYLISSLTYSDMSDISPSTVSSMNSINLLNSTTATASTTTPLMATIETLLVVFVLSIIVISCICGNILVILSVFTFRPLRTVQNFFIVSLAFSDMLVAITVMPFHIVTYILKRWIFGKVFLIMKKIHLIKFISGQIFCQIFVTCDVLLCTSSILNLCAIAVSYFH